MTEAIRDAVQHSKDLSNWIGDRIDGRAVQADRPTQLAGASFHISLVHHSSVPLLVGDGRHVSALALIRPQVDSYLRGLWLRYVAEDAEIVNVMNGNNFPSGPILMAKLEDVDHFNKNSLTSLAGENWSVLCDFTHGGSRAITRHLTGTSIESNFDDDEILETLRVADAWALMAGIAVASLARNTELESDMLTECHRRAALLTAVANGPA